MPRRSTSNTTTNAVKSRKDFSCTMFQGLVYFPLELNIHHIVHRVTNLDKLVLFNQDNSLVQSIELLKTNVKVHPPGSLGVNLDISPMTRTEDIGTIDFKATPNRKNHHSNSMDDKSISVLLFKDKMKISGGFSSIYGTTTTLITSDKIMHQYMVETATIFLSLVTTNEKVPCHTSFKVKMSLINGYMRLGYSIPHFMNFCKNHFLNNDLFDRVVLPLENERGRIGAVRLYPFKGVKSSAHFDHMGAIQFFAFKSIDDMMLFSSILQQIIDSICV